VHYRVVIIHPARIISGRIREATFEFTIMFKHIGAWAYDPISAVSVSLEGALDRRPELFFLDCRGVCRQIEVTGVDQGSIICFRSEPKIALTGSRSKKRSRVCSLG